MLLKMTGANYDGDFDDGRQQRKALWKKPVLLLLKDDNSKQKHYKKRWRLSHEMLLKMTGANYNGNLDDGRQERKTLWKKPVLLLLKDGNAK